MPTPRVLLLGATGGCGSQALVRLLARQVPVIAIVRSDSRLPAAAKGHALLTVVVAPAGHLALGDAALAEHMRGVDVVVSCLGHNLSFKGMYGAPRMLCVETCRRVCDVARLMRPPSPIRLIVVSTEGVSRPDGADPPRSLAERLVIGLLWLLLPPMADNVRVVDYLHHEARANEHVEFCAPRPSDMRDGEACAFATHSTLQNGLFNAGATTRANVGEFMADLVTEPATWRKWKNSFPHVLDALHSVTPNYGRISIGRRRG